MQKIIKTALSKAIVIYCLFSINLSWAQETLELYDPESVLNFIDFQKTGAHLYLFGEHHLRSDNYKKLFIQLANEQRAFYLKETQAVDESTGETPHPINPLFIVRSIDDIRILTLSYFLIFYQNFIQFAFSDTFINQPSNTENSDIENPEVDQEIEESLSYVLNNLINAYKFHPSELFGEAYELKNTHNFASVLYNGELKDGNLKNPALLELMMDATLNLLQFIQTKSEYALSTDEFEQVTKWLNNVHNMLNYLFDINFLNSLVPLINDGLLNLHQLENVKDLIPVGHTIIDRLPLIKETTLNLEKNITLIFNESSIVMPIILEKRNLIFANAISKHYIYLKKENLPVLVAMGAMHLPGVSALLKEQGISHTCVNLETMQETEVFAGVLHDEL